MPTRAYMEQKVIPFIYEALTALEAKRPDNPLEYFAYYLMANNPYAEYNKKGENNEG
jgi:protein dpy-30